MAKTILNLKLFYKGKLLDIAKNPRDFTNKMYIGSDRFIYWQILDDKFPEKHLFLEKKGESYYLNILQDMDVSCNKGTEVMDKNALKQNKLLNNNELRLSPETTGTITFRNNWQINFEFTEPYIAVMTPEQKQIVHQYARRAELTPLERTTRLALIISVVFSIIMMVIYDKYFENKVVAAKTFEEQWKDYAQKVTPEIPEVAPSTTIEQPKEEAGEKGEEETPKEGKVAKETGKPSKAGTGAASFMGGDFDPTAAVQAKTFTVTRSSAIVAASLGSEGGRPGTGTGPGKSSKSGGPDYGSTFDPTVNTSTSSSVGGLVTGKVRGEVSHGPSSGPASIFTGDASRIVPAGQIVARPPAMKRVIDDFNRDADVKKIAQTSEAALPPEAREDLSNVDDRIESNKKQINRQFEKDSKVVEMYGSLMIELYINEDGTVAWVDITPLAGSSFTEAFVENARNIALGWRFNVSRKMKRPFTMRFVKK